MSQPCCPNKSPAFTEANSAALGGMLSSRAEQHADAPGWEVEVQAAFTASRCGLSS